MKLGHRLSDGGLLFGLRALLECLGKADKGREERDHSSQELHGLSEIGLGITSHRMEGSARHKGCRQRC